MHEVTIKRRKKKKKKGNDFEQRDPLERNYEETGTQTIYSPFEKVLCQINHNSAQSSRNLEDFSSELVHAQS